MWSTENIDRRLLVSFLVVAAVVVALLAATLATPADAQGKPDGRGQDASLAARLAALEEQVAAQGEQLAAQGEQLADQGEQLSQLVGTVDSQAVQLVALEALVDAFADAACPTDEVVIGLADRAPVCAPVRTLASPDSAASVAVNSGGVTVTGADGSQVKLDGSGVRIRANGTLALRGTTATLEGDATATVRGSTARMEAAGSTEIRGSLVQLGSPGGCHPVARVGDLVSGGAILSGAPTILAC